MSGRRWLSPSTSCPGSGCSAGLITFIMLFRPSGRESWLRSSDPDESASVAFQHAGKRMAHESVADREGDRELGALGVVVVLDLDPARKNDRQIRGSQDPRFHAGAVPFVGRFRIGRSEVNRREREFLVWEGG